MVAKIQRWGNSLAVRIPKAFATEVGIKEGSSLDLAIENGDLVLTPRRSPDLRAMLDAITDENLHAEVEWGSAEGSEVW